MKRLLILAALPFAFAAFAPANAQVIYSPNSAGLPFSDAVQAGDMLYLSGQIGVAEGETTLAPGGIEGEGRQAMDNIGTVLKRRGLGFDSLVKCTVMLADMKDWPAFNKIYVGYFKPDSLPARSAFGASGLAFGGRVEIECWAYNPKK